MKADDGKDSFVGAMAKAAAPKRRPTKEDKYMTKADFEMAITENRQTAKNAVWSITRLASDDFERKEAAAAGLCMEGVTRILRNREKERSREKFAE